MAEVRESEANHGLYAVIEMGLELNAQFRLGYAEDID